MKKLSWKFLLELLLCISAAGFGSVSGHGILRIAFQSWIYSGTQDCDARLPDDPENFKCDPIFTIRVMRIGRPGYIFEYAPEMYIRNENVVAFPEYIFNISNPIVIPVRNNTGLMQLQVQAYDHEHKIKAANIDKPINQSVKYRLIVLNNTGSVYSEQHGLRFSYSFVCSPDSVDRLCNNECRPRDDTEHGHYACDRHGNKHCLKGWIRPSSNCTQAHDCATNRPCSDNGVCIPFNETAHHCQCNPGFTDQSCAVYSEACARANCTNGAACRDEPDGAKCICSPGFGGDKCANVETVRCRPELCQNGGTCAELVDGFACTCGQGFGGRHCETDTDECTTLNSPCMNGGTCVNTVGSFRCNCPTGLRGDLCQIDVDECRDGAARCGQGQRCVNTQGGFNCIRSDGEDCAGNPCKNGGVCRDMKFHFVCDCPTIFGGPACETGPDF